MEVLQALARRSSPGYSSSTLAVLRDAMILPVRAPELCERQEAVLHDGENDGMATAMASTKQP